MPPIAATQLAGLAEGAGFEPARRFFTVYTLSRHAPSTARPPLLRLAQPSEADFAAQYSPDRSEHPERALALRRREGAVERRAIFRGQDDIERAPVVAHMLKASRLGDHDHTLLP